MSIDNAWANYGSSTIVPHHTVHKELGLIRGPALVVPVASAIKTPFLHDLAVAQVLC